MIFNFAKPPEDISDVDVQPNDKAYEFAKILVKEFDFALDIGANIGTMSRRMGLDFKKVEAFEPLVPEYTKINTQNLGNVKVHPIGLGNEDKIEEIYVMAHKTGGSSIVEHPRRKWQQDASKKEITIKPLDLIANYSKIDFIKIDVESYEYFVIDGARKTLAKHSPVIMIEYLKRYAHHTYPPEMTHQILDSLGYKVIETFGDDSIYVKE